MLHFGLAVVNLLAFMFSLQVLHVLHSINNLSVNQTGTYTLGFRERPP